MTNPKDTVNDEKLCLRCLQLKVNSEFHTNSQSIYGLCYLCKQCFVERCIVISVERKTLYKNNPHAVLNKNPSAYRIFVENNMEIVLKSERDYEDRRQKLKNGFDLENLEFGNDNYLLNLLWKETKPDIESVYIRNLIELKRTQLQLNRKIKEMTK